MAGSRNQSEIFFPGVEEERTQPFGAVITERMQLFAGSSTHENFLFPGDQDPLVRESVVQEIVGLFCIATFPFCEEGRAMLRLGEDDGEKEHRCRDIVATACVVP